jgi:hypothetical protein
MLKILGFLLNAAFFIILINVRFYLFWSSLWDGIENKSEQWLDVK